MTIKLRLGEDLDEWYFIVRPILLNPEYEKRKTYRHHGDTTVYEHCVKISIKCYQIAKRHNLDYKSLAIAGLLHDFYETPWQDVVIKQPIYKMHLFTHARNALENSRKYFGKYMNPIVEDCILKHMWPVNLRLPKYKEGLILTYVDKTMSLDMLTSPESLFKTIAFMRRS